MAARTGVEWEEAGFEPLEAKEWEEAGFDALEAKEWKAAGFSPEWAWEWHIEVTPNGCWPELMTPERALEWFVAGFSPDAARLWIGFDDWSEDPVAVREALANEESARNHDSW